MRTASSESGPKTRALYRLPSAFFFEQKNKKKGGEGFREKPVRVKRKWFQAIPLTLKAIFIPKDETPRNYYLLLKTS